MKQFPVILVINNVRDMGNTIYDRRYLYAMCSSSGCQNYIRELGPEFYKMDKCQRDFIFKTYASILSLRDNYVSSDDEE